MRSYPCLVGGCIFAILSVGLLSIGAENPPINGTERIQSENDKEREQGKRLVLEERSRVVKSLINIVKSPYKKGVDRWNGINTSRNIAIQCIAEYRATEAIPVLIPHLGPAPGEMVTTDAALRLCPSANALVKIGRPAVPALIEFLSSANDTTKDASWQARLALFDIEGKVQAQELLKTAATSEKDRVKAANLQAQLKAFESELK